MSEYGFDIPDNKEKNNIEDDSEGSYKRLLNGKEITLFWLLQHYSPENAAAYKAQQAAKKSGKNQPVKTSTQTEKQKKHVKIVDSVQMLGESQKIKPEISAREVSVKDEEVTVCLESTPSFICKAELECVGYGQTVTINKEKFVIGRDKKNSHLCIADNKCIGRVHAQIMLENSRYYILDLESLNKTFVNGRQIPAGIKQELSNEDKIRLADEEFIFRVY